MPPTAERRDRLGRRVGYNWWRDYNCTLLLDATLAWERAAESETSGYETELAEYAAKNPRPNLKNFLIQNAGMGSRA